MTTWLLMQLQVAVNYANYRIIWQKWQQGL
jgi:hypothetical protein